MTDLVVIVLPYIVAVLTFFAGRKKTQLSNRLTEIEIWRDLANQLKSDLDNRELTIKDIMNQLEVIRAQNVELLSKVNQLQLQVTEHQTAYEILLKKYKQLEKLYTNLLKSHQNGKSQS